MAVVICAYTEDRWDDLGDAVASSLAQTRRPTEVVVVIDHNDAMLERARRTLTDAVVIANDGPRGLSGARNQGVKATTAEVVAFLDDDAVADPDWLALLATEYADPDVIGVGGSISPLWLAGRPGWFPEEFQWVVGCTYRGMPEQVAQVRNMIGANMSVRREVFEAGVTFASTVGQIGASMLRCDDTEFCIRVNQMWPQRRIVYAPAAHVRHRVPAGRSRWGYFRERCYTEGLAKAQIAGIVGSADGLSAERDYVRKALPSGVLRGIVDTARTADAQPILRSASIVAGLALTTAGYLKGSLARRRRGPAVPA